MNTPDPMPIHPDPARPSQEPNLADELWTNAHLLAYFRVGSTKLCHIKRQPGFPAPAVIAGLQRYPADQVRAYALAQQQPAH